MSESAVVAATVWSGGLPQQEESFDAAAAGAMSLRLRLRQCRTLQECLPLFPMNDDEAARFLQRLPYASPEVRTRRIQELASRMELDEEITSLLMRLPLNESGAIKEASRQRTLVEAVGYLKECRFIDDIQEEHIIGAIRAAKSGGNADQTSYYNAVLAQIREPTPTAEELAEALAGMQVNEDAVMARPEFEDEQRRCAEIRKICEAWKPSSGSGSGAAGGGESDGQEAQEMAPWEWFSDPDESGLPLALRYKRAMERVEWLESHLKGSRHSAALALDSMRQKYVEQPGPLRMQPDEPSASSASRPRENARSPMVAGRVDFLEEPCRDIIDDVIAPEVVDQICAEVQRKLRNGELPPPPKSPEDRENTVVHSFVNGVLDAIIKSAQAHGIEAHRVFHAYDASAWNSQKGRPDFVVTMREEQRCGPFSTLFYIEAKRLDHPLPNAIAQILKRIGLQYWETGYKLRFGIGVATDGVRYQVVRVDFIESASLDSRSASVVAWWSESPILHLNASEADDEFSALPYLVRLMCDRDITHYGLPESGGLPRSVLEKYARQAELGVGAFGKVFEVMTGEDPPQRYACKVARDPEDRGKLRVEHDLLQELTGVSGIPTVIDFIESRSGRPLALITTPVGTPVPNYAEQLDEGGHLDFVSQLARSVYEILEEAHGKGVCHGDVRPANILVVLDEHTASSGGERLRFYLIAWGLGCQKRYKEYRPAASITKGDWEPTPASDLEQLALTCLHVFRMADPVHKAPWSDARTSLSLRKHALEERVEWFEKYSADVDTVRRVLPDRLPGLLDAIRKKDNAAMRKRVRESAGEASAAAVEPLPQRRRVQPQR